MWVSAKTIKKPLKDITETSGVEIRAIRPMEGDAIISSPGWVAIDVLLEFMWKAVRGYGYFGFNITFCKFITKNSVAILR